MFRVFNELIDAKLLKRLPGRGKYEKTGNGTLAAYYGGESNGNGKAATALRQSGPSVRVVPYRDDGTVLIIIGNRTFMGSEVAFVSKRGERHAG
jgi:hypothetical protein